MKFILGKKIDMTQVWQGDKVVAVTRVQAGPCAVVQVKTEDKDGYSAVQVGYGERKEKNIKKPQLGHLKKTQKHKNTKTNLRYLREFRISPDTPEDAKERQLKIGDVVDVNTFEAGDKIQVESVSKGKGFQGVVKRHGFHGQDKTHGTKDQLRMPGSIGATGPAHVFKGQKMPGRMGGDQVTVKGLEVVEVDKENNILLIKGAVPGARNGLVLVQGEGELKLKVESQKVESEKTTDDRSADAEAVADKQQATEDETKESTKTLKHKNPDARKARSGSRLTRRDTETMKHENKEKNIEKVESKKTEEAEEETTEKNKVEDKIETPEDVEKEVVEAKKRVDEKKVAEDNKVNKSTEKVEEKK